MYRFKANRKSQQLFPFVMMAVKHDGIPIFFNFRVLYLELSHQLTTYINISINNTDGEGD